MTSREQKKNAKNPKPKEETTKGKEGMLPFWVWPVVYQQQWQKIKNFKIVSSIT